MKTYAYDTINPKSPESHCSRDGYIEGGLTKREYFATKILQGLLASNPSPSESSIILNAVNLADKLIEQLNSKGELK